MINQKKKVSLKFQTGFLKKVSEHLPAATASIRDNDCIFLTPTGVSLGDINTDNISVTDIKGNHIEGPKPTKEKELHLSVYKRCGTAGCILHVHPVNSIALSILLSGRGILFSPSATPQFVMRCGKVPVIPYAHPGSIELVKNMNEAELDKAVMMANHGVIAFGASPVQALNTLEELEENSRIILLAGIDEKMLSLQEVNELLERKM